MAKIPVPADHYYLEDNEPFKVVALSMIPATERWWVVTPAVDGGAPFAERVICFALCDVLTQPHPGRPQCRREVLPVTEGDVGLEPFYSEQLDSSLVLDEDLPEYVERILFETDRTWYRDEADE